MATPEHIKQRARELGEGRSAGEIRRALDREFPDEYIPTERTIRRWLIASPAIHIEQELDSIHTSVHGNRKEHYEQLASVANVLLENDLNSALHGWTTKRVTGQDVYILTRKNKVGDYYDLTKEQLSDQLKENIVLAEHKYERWFFHDCFLQHLGSELPEDLKGKGILDVVNEQPYQLVETLRVLAARKTFKGTCPVCKDWV